MQRHNTSARTRRVDRVYRFDHVGVVQQTFIVKANSESDARIKLSNFILSNAPDSEGPTSSSCVEALPTRVDPRIIDLPISSALVGGEAEKSLVSKELAILSLKIKTGYREGQ